MSVWQILLGALFLLLSVAVTLGGYYLISGDWLWERGEKKEDRNWSPPP
jgi:hypothetical protein